METTTTTTPVVSGGAINLRNFDSDIYHRTLKIFAPGQKVAGIYQCLLHFVEPRHIQAIGKVDATTFHVTIMDRDAFYTVLDAGNLIMGDRTYKIIRVSDHSLDIKCHWLPEYLSDDFVGNYFSQFGKVKTITHDRQIVDDENKVSLNNCVRTVSIQTGEMGVAMIPHLVKFDGGVTMLLTIMGREPLCLKCHNVGHMRRTCPQGQPRTWANVAQGPAQQQMDGRSRRSQPAPSQQSQAPARPPPATPARQTTATSQPYAPIVTITASPAPTPPTPTTPTPTPSQTHVQVTGESVTDDDDMDLLTAGQAPLVIDYDAMEPETASEKRPHDDDDTEYVMKRGRAVPIN